MSTVTIVMYHYVRDPQACRFPDIKARRLEEFRTQLDFIARNFTVIRADDLFDAIDGKLDLPDKSCLLTFDDGYIDHFTNVFPLLLERGWQGSFFPPVRCIRDRELLDVNKIHFLLAGNAGHVRILESMREFVDAANREHKLSVSWDEYLSKYAAPGRFDSGEIAFTKRMLQFGLPRELREPLLDDLLRTFVTEDAASLADELYMTVDQLKTMLRGGMFVGGHGVTHRWLTELNPGELEQELCQSREFLSGIGARSDRWMICYPYGGYDGSVLNAARAARAAIGLTTRVGVADLNVDLPLELPRLDTNDLPVS